MVKRSSFLFFFLLFFLSCGNKSFNTPEEMAEYIADESNNLLYRKTINGVSYTLQYKPTDLLVQQELGKKHTKQEVEKLRKQYNKYLYFNLAMSLNGQELLSNVVRDKNKFGQMVNDLAFYMDEKVHLYTPNKDTIAMTDFIYPRMYGMTSDTKIMLVFPRDKNLNENDYLNFTIQDLGFYTGEVKFKVQTQPIQKEPTLNL